MFIRRFSHSLYQALRAPRAEPIISLALIVITCFLAFGIHIPFLGIYWDDYASLYVFQRSGGEALSEWIAGQARPVNGWIVEASWALLGVRVTAWHLLNLGHYLLSVILFWGILRLIWPRYPVQMTLIALLFAVYPAYHLRPVQISSHLSSSLILFLLSFWLSLIAIKRQNFVLALVGAALVPLYQLTYDQGLAYEFLRPFALFSLLPITLSIKGRLRALLPYALPYALMSLAALIYRFILFQPSPTYAGYNEPHYLYSLDTLILAFKRTLSAPLELILYKWILEPQRSFISLKTDLDIPASLGLILLTACLAYLCLHPPKQQPNKQTFFWVGGLSFITIMGLVVAIHLVGRVIVSGFDSRWALFPSLLAALVIGLGLPRLLRSIHLGMLGLALMIALGLMTQVAVNEEYRADWELRRALWWEMRWRAPDLENGTMIALILPEDALAFKRQLTDYEITAHSNLYYSRNPENYPAVVGIEPYSYAALLWNDRPTSGQWSERIFQDWDYDRGKLVVFGYDGGCLKTASPNSNYQAMNAPLFESLAPYHQPAQIIPHAPNQPATYENLVSPEPAHTWCFFYQQISLAQQMNDAQRAAELADQARAAGFRPELGYEVEWLPLIWAYVETGRLTEAESLIYRVAFSESDQAPLVLCEMLNQENSANDAWRYEQISHLAACRGAFP